MGGLLLVGTGCMSSLEKRANAMVPMTEDRVFPAKPKFTIQPEAVSVGTGIDFAAVYYREHKLDPGITSDRGSYFRFWADGRVVFRLMGRKPMALEADQFDGVWLGYYQVKEGKLSMEFFAPITEKYGWDYWRIEAVVEGDKIKTVSEEKNRKKVVVEKVYGRHGVEGMKRGTDW